MTHHFTPQKSTTPSALTLPHGQGQFLFDGTKIMGVLNVTPDSFSDGGDFLAIEDAITQALTMLSQGAHIIDIGGESTRPGSQPATFEQEHARVIPVIKELVKQAPDAIISVDTTKARLAKEAIEAGAHIVNDISAGTFDDQMMPTISSLGVPYIMMHTRGRSDVMQSMTDYNTMEVLMAYFTQRLEAAKTHGIAKTQLILDPGIGFGKTVRQNCEILAHTSHLLQFGQALLVGTSRKSFLGALLKDPDTRQPRAVQERLAGSLASASAAILGGAHVVRVHDVAQTLDTICVLDAIRA